MSVSSRRIDGTGVPGLFKIPADGGTPERIADGHGLDPVWLPDGNLIVYAGAQVNAVSPLLGVHPDGEPVELPEMAVFQHGERVRFLPDGSRLVYMRALGLLRTSGCSTSLR